MTRVVLAAVLAAGCTPAWTAHARPPTVAESEHVRRVAVSWLAEGQPWSPRCDDAIARLRVARVPPERIGAACYSPSAGACLSVRAPRAILVRGDLGERAHGAAIRHETTHILASCALGHSDRRHRVPGLWERTSGRESVEWRARP